MKNPFRLHPYIMLYDATRYSLKFYLRVQSLPLKGYPLITFQHYLWYIKKEEQNIITASLSFLVMKDPFRKAMRRKNPITGYHKLLMGRPALDIHE